MFANHILRYPTRYPER